MPDPSSFFVTDVGDGSFWLEHYPEGDGDGSCGGDILEITAGISLPDMVEWSRRHRCRQEGVKNA